MYVQKEVYCLRSEAAPFASMLSEVKLHLGTHEVAYDWAMPQKYMYLPRKERCTGVAPGPHKSSLRPEMKCVTEQGQGPQRTMLAREPHDI